MTIDPTLSFGAILNAAVLLVGFVVAFTRIGGRIDLLTLRMASVEKSREAKSDFDKRISTLEERVTNHVTMLTTAQRDISDMRRGEGFVAGSRRGIDGEY